jgi:hypothetical protein
MSDMGELFKGYADGEMKALQAIRTEEVAARDEVQKLELLLDQTRADLIKRKGELQRADRSAVLAKAARAGKAAPPEPVDPPGPKVADLEATIAGLERMKAEAAEVQAKCVDRLRVVGDAMFLAVAERAAVDYVDLAEKLSDVHTLIGACQNGLNVASKKTIIGHDWHNLEVPHTTELKALKGLGRQLNWKVVLYGADPAWLFEQAGVAFGQVRGTITSTLGGRWPFDKR